MNMDTTVKSKFKEGKQPLMQDSGNGKNPGSNVPHNGNFDENEVDLNLFQGLDNPIESFNALLVAPNATTPEEIVAFVNNNRSPSALSGAIGKLVEPGKIGILSVNGQIELLPPGRYTFWNPRASLKSIESLTNNLITYESLTITRVNRGEVGFAMNNGQPLLLGEGIHVRNDRLFQFLKTESVNQQTLKHGSIHMIRVPKGHYGLITENGVPKLLPEGTHVTNSNVFNFEKFELINQPYIHHGTLHILRIPKGKVALVNDNNKPRLLEGTHCINSKTFTFFKMEDVGQLVIRHGTITQFRVRKGEVGLGWDNNSPVFFDEGVYHKDSPLFTFESCVSASEKLISLGAKKIVTVWDGEVGVSYLKGKLIVLKPDRHTIDSTEHIFQGFLSTQQQCLHLVDPKYAKDGILSCETKDFVEIGLKADVFYKIADAEKVLLVVGKDNVDPLVRETAVATLNSIIRSTSLAEVAQNKEFAAKSEKAHRENQPAAPMFFDKVHDEFITKLHDSFMDQFGISITNIRIESFKIMNQELATSISKQAFTTAQTETQLSNLAGQTEIATAQMKRDAEVARIRAEGESIKLKTETDAKNRSVMESAKAEADATVIRARAEATAIEVKAQAEAKSILLKAEAESKRAEMLSSTPLGGQIQMYQMYAAMVQSSLQGVEKVIYMPTDAMNNPLSFMNLQQGVIPGFTAAKK